MTYLKPYESGYIKMRANVARRNADAAVKMGEAYKSVASVVDLECGHSVSLVIERSGETLYPVLTVNLNNKLIKGAGNPVALDIARELLGAKAAVYETFLGIDKKFTVDSEVLGGKADPVPGA